MIDQTQAGVTFVVHRNVQTIVGRVMIVQYTTSLSPQEIEAATSTGYVYFDLMDSREIHDMETTAMVCLKLDDFTRLERKMQLGTARKVWVLVPYGEMTRPRQITYADLQFLRDSFTSKFGPNGVVNKFDRND